MRYPVALHRPQPPASNSAQGLSRAEAVVLSAANIATPPDLPPSGSLVLGLIAPLVGLLVWHTCRAAAAKPRTAACMRNPSPSPCHTLNDPPQSAMVSVTGVLSDAGGTAAAYGEFYAKRPQPSLTFELVHEYVDHGLLPPLASLERIDLQQVSGLRRNGREAGPGLCLVPGLRDGGGGV